MNVTIQCFDVVGGQQVEQLVIEKVCYNNPEGSALGTLCDLEWL